MNDLEAARHIEQALLNLPEDYPDKDKAVRAYGRLILGRLDLKPWAGYMFHSPDKDSKWWVYKKED